MNDGRVHDRAGLDADPPGLQMNIHRLQHQPAQAMLFEQMTEALHSRLTGRQSDAEVHAHEPEQSGGLVQRFFHLKVR